MPFGTISLPQNRYEQLAFIFGVECNTLWTPRDKARTI